MSNDNNNHPLDNVFDTQEKSDLEELIGEQIEIPDDPSLKEIVSLALQQYKKLIMDSNLCEPEDKQRLLKLAEDYLSLAKDALYKEGDLTIKNNRAGSQKGTQEPKEQILTEEGGEEKKFSRHEAYEVIEGSKK